MPRFERLQPKVFWLSDSEDDSEEVESSEAEWMCYIARIICPTRKMADGVTKVIHRCEDGQESGQLDLSDCKLTQIPDAVFHLMRQVVLKGCNLSSNFITKIPAKLPQKFSEITELNLSHNRLGKLPDEIKGLQTLEKLDISHNVFLNFPSGVYELQGLKCLIAEKNFIAEVEVKPEGIRGLKALEVLDLRQNPIKEDVQALLLTLEKVEVKLSPIVQEEWEVIPSESDKNFS